MRRFRKRNLLLFLITYSMLFLNSIEVQIAIAQQPTGTVPTVTGTPRGPIGTIKVGLTEDRVNVRSGPSVLYPEIGIILVGAEVPVIGRSAGGDWLVIEYPGVPGGKGWVWALYFDVTPGELPVIENPPTPEPATTSTIDPTMAAQFITTPLATRLPTFTQPAPLEIPTFTNNTGQSLAGVPTGLIILALLSLGIIIGLFSYFQSR